MGRIRGKPIPATINFGGVKGKVLGFYDSKAGTIAFKTRTDKTIEDIKAEDNQAWRTKQRTNLPYHSTLSARGLVYHEIAHALDDKGSRLFSRSIAGMPLAEKRKVLAVSAYAGEDLFAMTWPAAEAWAESFAAIVDNSDRANLVPEPIAALVRRALGQK